jgi:membrane associated rhomboid family serine protease
MKSAASDGKRVASAHVAVDLVVPADRAYPRSRVFFFLPWGHDQPVYDRPWITYSLIGICTAIFVACAAVQMDAERDLDAAAVRIDGILERHPWARLSFEVHGLPEPLGGAIAEITDTTLPGDPELEGAVLEAIGAMNRMPVMRFGWRPAAPTPLRAITHAFMHADVFHLFGNMLILFLAGGVLECFWRKWAFVLLYVVAGASGLIAHTLADPSSLTPVVGASGAIAGLMGAFVIGYPRTRIKIFWFVLLFFRAFWGNWRAPAFAVIPLWAGMEVLHAVTGADDGVAYWAHVGGFACGAVAALIAHRAGLVATDAGRDVEAPVVQPSARSIATTPPARHGRSGAPRARDVAPIELPLAPPDDRHQREP